jgi:WD40 repeat protein
MEFKEHFQTITGLCESSGSETNTCIVSVSLDSHIRIWSLESGDCLHHFEVEMPILGIKLAKDGSFCTFEEQKISIWNLGQQYVSFGTVGGPVFHLERVVGLNNEPALIFASSGDGCFGIFSPLNGEKIVTGFPIVQNMDIVHSVIDVKCKKVYLLASCGEILVYSTSSNPATYETKLASLYMNETLNCISGLPKYSSLKFSVDCRFPILLIGSASGQIFSKHIFQHVDEYSIQAHTAELTVIQCSDNGEHVWTASADHTVKCWKVSYSDRKEENAKQIMGACIENRSPVFFHLTLIQTIQLDPSFGAPIFMKCSQDAQSIVLVTEKHRFLSFQRSDRVYKPVQKTSVVDDHSLAIKSLALDESIGLALTTGSDRLLKVWDITTSSLIRLS